MFARAPARPALIAACLIFRRFGYIMCDRMRAYSLSFGQKLTLRAPYREAISQDRSMKLITAIIKPFKLDQVREALMEAWRRRYDRQRGQGLRPPERPQGDLPRRRIPDLLCAEDQDRGRGSGGLSSSAPSKSSRRPRARARSATARFSSRQSSVRCASEPAKATATHSNRATRDTIRGRP